LIIGKLIENMKDKKAFIEEIFGTGLYTLETLGHPHIQKFMDHFTP